MPGVSPTCRSKDTSETACSTPPLAPPKSRSTNSWTTLRTSSRTSLPMTGRLLLIRVPAGPPATWLVLPERRSLLAAVLLHRRTARRERAARRDLRQVRRTAADHRQEHVRLRLDPGDGIEQRLR